MPPLLWAATLYAAGLALGPSVGITAIGGPGLVGAAFTLVWGRGRPGLSAFVVALAFLFAGALRAPPVPPSEGWVRVAGTVHRRLGPSRVWLRGSSIASWPTGRVRSATARSVRLDDVPEGCLLPGSTLRGIARWRPVRDQAARSGQAQLAVTLSCRPPPRRPVRDALHRIIEGVPAGKGRAVVRAMILGDRGEFDGALRDDLARAGLAHLVAISGLHLGLLGGAAGWVVGWGVRRRYRWLARWGTHRPQAVGAFVGAAAFAGLVGLPVSAVRAAAFIGVIAFASLASRRMTAWSTVGGALFALLAVRPAWIDDLGFRLSVSAVLGLLVFAGARQTRRWWLRGARASAAAIVGTAPVALDAFGRIAWIGVVTNLVAVPWTCFVVVPMALAGAALGLVCPSLGAAVLAASSWAAEGVCLIAAWGAAVPGEWVMGAHRSLPAFGVVAAAGLGWHAPRNTRWVAIGVAAVCLLAGVQARPGPQVVFLSVGHGDAAVVVDDDGRGMLIDTGTDRAFRRVVVPELLRLGLGRLEGVVITHPDDDHDGGLPALLERFDVGRVVLAPEDWEPLEMRDVKVEVLGPFGPRSTLSDNDASLVLRVHLGRYRILFAGDVERQGEAALVARWGTDLGTEILKVPHHGSRSSSSNAFLEAVAPQVAVVSIGPNPHGLPSTDVLWRLRRRGIRILRTDHAGTIRFPCPPDELGVRTEHD